MHSPVTLNTIGGFPIVFDSEYVFKITPNISDSRVRADYVHKPPTSTVNLDTGSGFDLIVVMGTPNEVALSILTQKEAYHARRKARAAAEEDQQDLSYDEPC